MSSVQQNVIKHKVGLLNLAAELGNVSRACKVMGFSRDTFYRYQAAVETGGVEALIDANRRKPNPKNRVEEIAESAVTAFALEQPAFGQLRVSNELRKRGIFVHPLVSARSGCDITSSRSRSACRHWRAMLPRPVKC